MGMLKNAASGRRRAKAAMATVRVPCLRRSEAPASRLRAEALQRASAQAGRVFAVLTSSRVRAACHTTVTPFGTLQAQGSRPAGHINNLGLAEQAFLNIPCNHMDIASS